MSNSILPAGYELRMHPFAKLFPPLEGEAFEAFAADIAAHGLREPVTVFRGELVDGCNRVRACRYNHMPIATVEYDGPGERLLDWCLSKNLARRHLTPSQRALIAAEAAQLVPPVPGKYNPILAATAATLDIGQRHAQYAQTVLSRGVPEIVEKVRSGEMSIYAADKIVMLPEKRQRKLAKASPERVKRELDRLGRRRGRFTGLSLRARVPRPAQTWHHGDLYTPFGKPIEDCDRAELTAAREKLAELGELLRELIDGMPPTGAVRATVPDKRWRELVKAYRR